MPLRHRRSSAGVVPRPDARPVLKNESPSVDARSVVPAPQSNVPYLDSSSAPLYVFPDPPCTGTPRLVPQRASSTSTARRNECPSPPPPCSVLPLPRPALLPQS